MDEILCNSWIFFWCSQLLFGLGTTTVTLLENEERTGGSAYGVWWKKAKRIVSYFISVTSYVWGFVGLNFICLECLCWSEQNFMERTAFVFSLPWIDFNDKNISVVISNLIPTIEYRILRLISFAFPSFRDQVTLSVLRYSNPMSFIVFYLNKGIQQ